MRTAYRVLAFVIAAEVAIQAAAIAYALFMNRLQDSYLPFRS